MKAKRTYILERDLISLSRRNPFQNKGNFYLVIREKINILAH